jgi:hypothetical protein
MQKWEYKVVTDESESSLNRLGAEGWELVSIVFADSATVFALYFKRPKP